MSTVKPLAWNDLPDIDDAEPFGPEDEACLLEIKEVLDRHGRAKRFGVALLHKHFEVANDEVLVEEVDVESRKLVTQPQKVTEVDHGRLKPTIWRFDGEYHNACAYCPTDEKGGHHGYKESH